MNYLLNEELVVTMKGSEISPKKNETLYNDKKDSYSSATMKEIAKSNGFKIKGKNQAELKSSMDSAFNKLELAKVITMSISKEILSIVKKGCKEGETEDSILISIVNSGVKFGRAIKHLKNAKIELGLSISNEDRLKKSSAIMEKAEFSPEDYPSVQKMVKKISKDVANTNEQQALIQIRKFCKENEIAMPSKPKGSSVPFMVKAIAWIASNKAKTNEDFEVFLEENNRSEKVVDTWQKKFTAVQKELGIEAPKVKEKKGKKAA